MSLVDGDDDREDEGLEGGPWPITASFFGTTGSEGCLVGTSGGRIDSKVSISATAV